MESEVDIQHYPMNNQQRRSREPPDKTQFRFHQWYMFIFMMNKEVPTMADAINRGPTYMAELSIENGIIDSMFALSSAVHYIGRNPLMMMLSAFGSESRKHRDELETMMMLPSQQEEPSNPLNYHLLDWSLALTCDPG
jgi:hypothetical protein